MTSAHGKCHVTNMTSYLSFFSEKESKSELKRACNIQAYHELEQVKSLSLYFVIKSYWKVSDSLLTLTLTSPDNNETTSTNGHVPKSSFSCNKVLYAPWGLWDASAPCLNCCWFDRAWWWLLVWEAVTGSVGLGWPKKMSWAGSSVAWGLTGSALANDVFGWLSWDGETELASAACDQMVLAVVSTISFVQFIIFCSDFVRTNINSVFHSCLKPFPLPVTRFRGYSDDFSCL